MTQSNEPETEEEDTFGEIGAFGCAGCMFISGIISLLGGITGTMVLKYTDHSWPLVVLGIIAILIGVGTAIGIAKK